MASERPAGQPTGEGGAETVFLMGSVLRLHLMAPPMWDFRVLCLRPPRVLRLLPSHGSELLLTSGYTL